MPAIEQLFHSIRECESHYHLCFGAVYGEHRFATPQAAKAACWQTHHEIAVRLYDGDEVLWNGANPVHAALADIEGRYNPGNAVVAVGRRHYLVRRSRFGIETAVAWHASAPVQAVVLGLLVAQVVHARDVQRFVYAKEMEHAEIHR